MVMYVQKAKMDSIRGSVDYWFESDNPTHMLYGDFEDQIRELTEEEIEDFKLERGL